MPVVATFSRRRPGSHTIVAGDAKPGATTTWYTKTYRDNFEPMVIFLVRTVSREAAVNGGIKEWRQKNHNDVRAEAFTAERAAYKFIWMLGADFGVPARPPRTVTSAEYRLIRDHFVASRAVIHLCRGDAHNRNAAMPDYPKADKPMVALLEKLGARK